MHIFFDFLSSEIQYIFRKKNVYLFLLIALIDKQINLTNK